MRITVEGENSDQIERVIAWKDKRDLGNIVVTFDRRWAHSVYSVSSWIDDEEKSFLSFDFVLTEELYDEEKDTHDIVSCVIELETQEEKELYYGKINYLLQNKDEIYFVFISSESLYEEKELGCYYLKGKELDNDDDKI